MASSGRNHRKSLNRIATNRLQKELVEWHKLNPNAPAGGELYRLPGDDLQHWTVEVRGAESTLYAGEKFTLEIDFPENYPMEAPQVIFGKNPPIHPHIYSNGHICLDILYDAWSPAMTVMSVCMSILSMLSSCTEKIRPEDDERYVKKCTSGKSPKETHWWFHDDTV